MSEQAEFQMAPINESTNKVETKIKESDHYQLKLVGFWIRFWAYSIDLVVVFAIGGLLIKPIFRVLGISVSNPAFLLFTPYKVTMLIILLLYFAIMTKYLSQTIGKMIMGIKVVSSKDEKLTWATIIYRELIGRFIAKLLTFPYLFVLFMPKKEALHDYFADTYVVYENVYEKVGLRQKVKKISGEQLPEDPLV